MLHKSSLIKLIKELIGTHWTDTYFGWFFTATLPLLDCNILGQAKYEKQCAFIVIWVHYCQCSQQKWTARVEDFNSLCSSTVWAWKRQDRSHTLKPCFSVWTRTATCFNGPQPSSLFLIWMASICRRFVQTGVRWQFQPYYISITGSPVNRIRLSTPFKTHWQLWHVRNQHNAETRSGWCIQHGHQAVWPPDSHHNTTERHWRYCFSHIQRPSQKHSSGGLLYKGRVVPLSKWKLESICYIQCPPHLS